MRERRMSGINGQTPDDRRATADLFIFLSRKPLTFLWHHRQQGLLLSKIDFRAFHLKKKSQTRTSFCTRTPIPPWFKSKAQGWVEGWEQTYWEFSINQITEDRFLYVSHSTDITWPFILNIGMKKIVSRNHFRCTAINRKMAVKIKSEENNYR